MAIIESCSDSPRTSISYDFGSPDAIASSVEQQTNQSTSLSNVCSDFCFHRNNNDQESLSSTADELFLDGKILPAFNRKIDNVSSKQILQPILVVPPFPPLQAYVHTNNSIRHCSEVKNKISNMNQESPSSKNSLVLSVELKKRIPAAKLMQSKPFPPLRDLLYGTSNTSVSNEAWNSKSCFKVKTGAGNGEEDRRKDLKPTLCSLNCCGFKLTSGNGVFGRGFSPFPLSYSIASVQNSSKIVSSLPRNSRMHQHNPKDSTSPVRHRSSSLKQLIVTDNKLHNSLPVRNRKPSLKQLIIRDYMVK